MSDELPPNLDLKRAAAWMELALVYGYNEIAKSMTTLGEKVYCRLARDDAERRATELGCKINRGDPCKVVLEMTTSPPWIIFHERDIEMMRAAVAKWDAENGKAT